MGRSKNPYSWNPEKVKQKYNYKCAKCGETFNLQAHDPTRRHTDWRVGIALCGVCHSKEHPDLCFAIFAPKIFVPYWTNQSIRSLAHELGCSHGTVRNLAKKLRISNNCEISEDNINRIKSLYNQRFVDREQTYDVQDISRIFTINITTAYNWVKKGAFKAEKTRSGKYFVSKDDVLMRIKEYFSGLRSLKTHQLYAIKNKPIKLPKISKVSKVRVGKSIYDNKEFNRETMYGIADIVDIFRVHKTTVRSWIRKGFLEAKCLGYGQYYIDKQYLEALVKGK